MITPGELVGKLLSSVSRDEASLGCHRFMDDHHSILILIHHNSSFRWHDKSRMNLRFKPVSRIYSKILVVHVSICPFLNICYSKQLIFVKTGMNIESLEVITIVNESLAQCYSQLHAIHLTSDILKQKNVTFCDDESLYYTCHYLKNFTFHLYTNLVFINYARKTCFQNISQYLQWEKKKKRQYI